MPQDCGADLPPPGTPLRVAILNGLRATAAHDVKKQTGDIRFAPTQVRARGGFAFVSAEIRILDPRSKSGTRQLTDEEIRDAFGNELDAFDGPRIDAVLKLDGATWKILEYAIGATDVSWYGADERYGLPKGVLPVACDSSAHE